MVDLIRKTLKSFYKAEFKTEWAGIEVSYFGERNTEEGRIKDLQKLGLGTFTDAYDDLKRDNIDPTALFNTQKSKKIYRFRKEKDAA